MMKENKRKLENKTKNIYLNWLSYKNYSQRFELCKEDLNFYSKHIFISLRDNLIQWHKNIANEDLYNKCWYDLSNLYIRHYEMLKELLRLPILIHKFNNKDKKPTKNKFEKKDIKKLLQKSKFSKSEISKFIKSYEKIYNKKSLPLIELTKWKNEKANIWQPFEKNEAIVITIIINNHIGKVITNFYQEWYKDFLEDSNKIILNFKNYDGILSDNFWSTFYNLKNKRNHFAHKTLFELYDDDILPWNTFIDIVFMHRIIYNLINFYEKNALKW